MNPMKVNVFTTDIEDIKQEEIGEYYPYDYGVDIIDRPEKVGDLVILEVFPHFDDVMKQVKYEQEDRCPPEYWTVAKVTRFTEEGGFYCKPLTLGTKLSQASKEKRA